MKLTELVTALEDYKQLVQNVIDPLVVLTSVNTTLGLMPATAVALPPPVAALPQLSENIGRLHPSPQAEKPKRKYKTRSKKSPAARRKPAARAKERGEAEDCPKHPGNTEWDTNGACSQCRREYQKNRRIAKGAKPRAFKSERPATEMRTTASSLDRLSPKLRKIADANRPKIAPPFPARRGSPDAFTGDEIEYSKPIKCPKCAAPATRMSRPEEFSVETDSWTCLTSGCQVRISHIVLAVDHSYEPDAA